jgi:hypothetical protein
MAQSVMTEGGTPARARRGISFKMENSKLGAGKVGRRMVPARHIALRFYEVSLFPEKFTFPSSISSYFDLFRLIRWTNFELFRGISTYFGVFRAISTYFEIKNFPAVTAGGLR